MATPSLAVGTPWTLPPSVLHGLAPRRGPNRHLEQRRHPRVPIVPAAGESQQKLSYLLAGSVSERVCDRYECYDGLQSDVVCYIGALLSGVRFFLYSCLVILIGGLFRGFSYSKMFERESWCYSAFSNTPWTVFNIATQPLHKAIVTAGTAFHPGWAILWQEKDILQLEPESYSSDPLPGSVDSKTTEASSVALSTATPSQAISTQQSATYSVDAKQSPTKNIDDRQDRSNNVDVKSSTTEISQPADNPKSSPTHSIPPQTTHGLIYGIIGGGLIVILIAFFVLWCKFTPSAKADAITLREINPRAGAEQPHLNGDMPSRSPLPLPAENPTRNVNRTEETQGAADRRSGKTFSDDEAERVPMEYRKI
jgi:hypothetical protein